MPDEIAWVWAAQKQDSVDIVRSDAVPAIGQPIDDPEYWNLKKSERILQLTTEGLTNAQYEAFAAVLGSAVSIDDQNGRTHVGIAISLAGVEVPGNEYHDQVTLTLRIQ